MPDKIKILFVGDVIGRPGRRALKRILPDVKRKYAPHFLVANAENAAGGVGITRKTCGELLEKIDVLTSGNHVWDKKDVFSFMDEEPRLLRPANYPPQNPGRGAGVYVADSGVKVGVLNLQGRVFMDAVDCPFRKAEEELESLRAQTPVVLVDFHAEATSEKMAMGWYLDGKVSAVLGTHTHVSTADERILPQGTAYLTDVGMVGGYDSVIGIKKEPAIQRFLTALPQRFIPDKGKMMFASVFLEVDSRTGKALSIQREIIVEDESEESDS